MAFLFSLPCGELACDYDTSKQQDVTINYNTWHHQATAQLAVT